MIRLTVVGFAALCLFGTSSLVLAEDAMKSEEVMGARKADMKDAAKGEKGVSKSEGMMGARKAGPADEVGNTVPEGVMSARKAETKAAKGDMKGKTKKHKDKAKAPAAPAPAP